MLATRHVSCVSCGNFRSKNEAHADSFRVYVCDITTLPFSFLHVDTLSTLVLAFQLHSLNAPLVKRRRLH